MTPTDALWLSGLTLLVFLIYLDHLFHALSLWLDERSWRAFRNLFIAVMLQMTLLRALIGIVQRAFPDALWLSYLRLVTDPILTLLVLSGGLVIAWTWRTDRGRT